MKLVHGTFSVALVLIGGAVVWAEAGGAATNVQQPASIAASAPVVAPPVNPLDAQRAYGYLQQICALGPRMSGSPGMKKQQELLEAHFKELGGNVSYQKFLAKHPLKTESDKVPMANMIVEWHPERMERILLVAHYDTRPLPDRDIDPGKRKTGVFIGANDGGSGTALLMELAHLMPKFNGSLGVDFLLVDAEEFVFVERLDQYCLGSKWFAQQYVDHPPKHKYRWGVVLDMIGDADLQVYQEKFSMTWRDSRPMVNEIWATAGRLGVKEFIGRIGYEVSDDHVPLRNIGKIPTCDIIDFQYMPWHQTSDTPQKCSGSSMVKVGWVVYEWLKGEAAKPPLGRELGSDRQAAGN